MTRRSSNTHFKSLQRTKSFSFIKYLTLSSEQPEKRSQANSYVRNLLSIVTRVKLSNLLNFTNCKTFFVKTFLFFPEPIKSFGKTCATNSVKKSATASFGVFANSKSSLYAFPRDSGSLLASASNYAFFSFQSSGMGQDLFT